MTTSPQRPNFFILLGLNPDAAWNQTQFESALRTKRNEWSRDGAGVAKKALAAKKNLALIPKINEVMSDPTQRKQEANEARAELSTARLDKHEQFEKQLAFINAKDCVEQSEINKFIDEFKDILQPAEIKQRIKVKLCVASSTTATSTTQQLDASLTKNITDRLQFIHMNTLYELLQRTSKTATPELFRAAEGLYTQLIRLPPTAEVTAKIELAGLARDIFRSSDARSRYDESLRQVSLNRLLKELDDSMSRSTEKELHQKQVLLLLDNAQKEGWSEKEALDRLKEHTRLRKWIMTAPHIDPEAQKLLCPYCGNLNGKELRYCTSCKRSLYINCPRCDTAVSCEYIACGHCGFAIGNRYLVDSLLEEIPDLLKVGNFQRAKELVDEAIAAWQPGKDDPRTQRINQNKQEIQRYLQDQQQKQKDSIEELQKLMREKRYVTARQLIASRGEALPQRGTQQRTIDAAISQAQELVKHTLAPHVSQENKIELCRQALALCADYQPARELLKTMPPAAPSKLLANVRGGVVNLSWEISATQNASYKVVRKARARPNAPGDGRVLGIITGNTFADSAPEAGLPLYYAVYATIDEATSNQAALLEQAVFVIQEVTQARVQVDNHVLVLSWSPPSNVQQVIVVRKEHSAPLSINDGKRCAEYGPTQKSFVDQDVVEGNVYYYKLYSQFKDEMGQSVTSQGIVVRATPEAPPTPLTHIEISETSLAGKRAIGLSWQKPPKGSVIIMKSARELQYAGKVLAEAQVSQLGQRLESSDNTATDVWKPEEVIYYTPVVLFQQQAYPGLSERYICIENVSALSYQNLGMAIRLNWTWPERCQEVYISHSVEQHVQHNVSPATTRRLSRAEYDHLGYYDIRGISNQDYSILVSAVIRQNEERLIAAGTRLKARLVNKMIINYEIKLPSIFRKKRTLRIMTNTASELPTLLLVSKRDKLPFRKTDGNIFHRILDKSIDSSKEVQIELPDGPLPPKTMGKLFLEDDDLYDEFTIHHPGENQSRLS